MEEVGGDTKIQKDAKKDAAAPRRSSRRRKPTAKRSSWLYDEDLRKKPAGVSKKMRKGTSSTHAATDFDVFDDLKSQDGVHDFLQSESNFELKSYPSKEEQKPLPNDLDITALGFGLTCHSRSNDDLRLPLKKRKAALFSNELSEGLSAEELPTSTHVCLDHSYVDQEVESSSESGTVSDVDEPSNDAFYEQYDNRRINEEIDKGTIGDILGEEIPDEAFESDLPSAASFLVDKRRWDELYRRRKGRCLPAGEWQCLFVDGIKKTNKYCVFNFKRHSIGAGRRGSLFRANGECKFEGCPVQVNLQMDVCPVVDVKYFGNVKHKITEKQARYIRKGERQVLKGVFENGKMPSKQFKESVKAKDTRSLIAGNYDGIGKTTSVLQKIASESHQTGRMDKDVVVSLLKMKHNVDMNKKKQVAVIPGFIQDICLDPAFIHYWNKECIILWNKLCQTNVAFLDATGSIVRKTERGAKMLYYEMALAHPKKPNMSLPVAMMVTEKQSEPYVTHFLRQFRHSEKSLKGHSSVKQPMQINTDWSWVMINSVLEVFNHENLHQYLLRSWKLLNIEGKEEDFSGYTVLHVCLSHHMKLVKHKCQTLSKSMMFFGMYFMSLLTRCETLEEARSLLFHCVIVLRTRNFTEQLKPHVRTIMRRMNSLKTEIPQNEAFGVEETEQTIMMPQNQVDEKNMNQTEEQVLHEAPYSPFKSWFRKIVAEADEIVTRIDTCTSKELNKYYCPTYFEKVLLHYLPTFPLWSNILLPNNRKLKQQYREKGLDVDRVPVFTHTKPSARTQGIIEQRFKVLKCLQKCGNKYLRLDDFSNNLREHCESTIKAGVLECLKETPRKRKLPKENLEVKFEQPDETFASYATPKKTVLVKESWSKKQIPKDNLGVFQTPPKKVFRTADCITKKKSGIACVEEVAVINYVGIPNLGSTCWFSSSLQAIAKAAVGDSIIAMKEFFVPLIQDSQLFIDLLDKVRKGQDAVTDREVISILFGNNNTRSDTSISGLFDATQQQDVTEFYFLYLNKYLEEMGPRMEIVEERRCSNCQREEVDVKQERKSHLHLDVPHNSSVNLSVQSLVNSISVPDTIDKDCVCGPLKRHVCKTYYVSATLPTLCLIMKRFMMAPKNRVKKNLNEVDIDLTINFCDKTYILKSIVVHKGTAINSGHYYSIDVTKEHHQSFITVCDDKYIAKSLFKGTWDLEVRRNCVMLMYDCVESHRKVHESKPLVSESVLSCLNILSCTRLALEFWSTKNDCSLEEKAAQQKMDFLKSMQDMSVLQSLRMRIMKKPKDVVDHFITNMYKTDDGMNLYVYSLTNLQLLHGFRCASCKYEVTELADAPGVINVENISEKGLMEAVKQNILSSNTDTTYQPCGCSSEEDRIVKIVHFPSSLLLSFQPQEDFNVNTLQNKLLFEDLLMDCSNEYKLLCILIHVPESETIALKFLRQGVFEYITKYPGTLCPTAVLQSFITERCTLYMFYDKKPTRNIGDIKTIPFNDMSSEDVLYSNSTCKIQNTRNAKTTLNADSWNRLKSPRRWYNSDILDAYMKLLSDASELNVKCLPSGWLDQQLFFESEPENPKKFFPVTLHNRSNWFDYDFVIVPVNEGNAHWILYIIDIKQKRIFFCNSKRHAYYNFNIALLRSLAVEFCRKFLQRFDWHSFPFIKYNDQCGFQYQNDNFNCGPYVCIMAKCIIFGKKFATDKAMRHTIALELYHNQLLM